MRGTDEPHEFFWLACRGLFDQLNIIYTITHTHVSPKHTRNTCVQLVRMLTRSRTHTHTIQKVQSVTT